MLLGVSFFIIAYVSYALIIYNQQDTKEMSAEDKLCEDLGDVQETSTLVPTMGTLQQFAGNKNKDKIIIDLTKPKVKEVLSSDTPAPPEKPVLNLFGQHPASLDNVYEDPLVSMLTLKADLTHASTVCFRPGVGSNTISLIRHGKGTIVLKQDGTWLYRKLH